MALPPCEQRHHFLRYEGLEYSDVDIADFKEILARIYRREVHRVPVFDFGGLPYLMAEGLSTRMRRMSWREFILALRLHTDEEMQTAGFGAYWANSASQIPNKGDLRDYWIGISSVGDFLDTAPSYTMIRDPILRLCHRLIACSIAGRSQAPEKVTVTDLFYLRGMDVDSVNIPYLLARYLRLFAAGRKSGAHISEWQFVARLAEHFRLLTAEILGGLTVIALKLPIIDMAELDALNVDEGSQDDLTPIYAPPAPPAPSRTMPQRMDITKHNFIYIPGVDSHQLRMKIFPLSLADEAKQWWIKKGEGKITIWEELTEKFFCKFYPESYDGEEEMLDEGDNWGIDPFEFISRVNSSFDKHMKMDGRTKKVLFHAWINENWNKRQIDESILRSNNTTTDSFFKPYLITHGKSDTKQEDEQSQTKHKYSNTCNSIDEQPKKRRCKAKKFEAI
ncbi:hypothetical protein Tco_1555352 [Tanacetum coccineum]